MSQAVLIGVAGGGLMGSGIAAKLSAAGREVIVHDSAPDAAQRIRNACVATLDELVAGGVMTTAQAEAAAVRVRVAKAVTELVDAGIVFEAISESLPAKQALYGELEEVLADDAIIASTTSGFTPERLFQKTRRGDRCLVAHFWNPPHLIPLVEVLASEMTSPAAVESTMRLLREVVCSPVQLHKAVPGFIGNRIQFAVLREALHLVREGVADAETIDVVVKQTLGRRYRWIGPLEGADAGGLETFLHIASHLMPELAKGEDVLDTLRECASRGHKGRATGRGLYLWDESRQQRYRDVRLQMLRDADLPSVRSSD